MIYLNILTIFTLVVLSIVPPYLTRVIKNIALLMSGLIFVISLSYFSFSQMYPLWWATSCVFSLSFHTVVVGYTWILDPFSLAFVVLTTFLAFVGVYIAKQQLYEIKGLFLLIFLMEFLVINAFTAVELLFFYVLFEATLIPIFVIIGRFGSQNKTSAANQFFLYTLFGSFFMLVGIVLLYILVGSSNIYVIKEVELAAWLENVIFFCFFMSFAIKIPMFPFHLWLPKAHVEAPTVGSVLLAGILLKLGSYGFLRFCLFLFPSASLVFEPLIVVMCILSIVSASFAALCQVDLKRIIAYSSIAHMNFAVCALFSNTKIGVLGSLVLQVAHGFSSAVLFFLIGALYQRYSTRNLFYYGGLSLVMPKFSSFFFLANLINMSFPFTGNFIGELLGFAGIFGGMPSLAMLSLVGVLLAAVYSFVLVTRVIFGPYSKFISRYSDLSRLEFYIGIILVLPVIVIGVYPAVVIDWFLFPVSLVVIGCIR